VAPFATEMLSFATSAMGEALLRHDPPYQLPLGLGLTDTGLEGPACALSLVSSFGRLRDLLTVSFAGVSGWVLVEDDGPE